MWGGLAVALLLIFSAFRPSQSGLRFRMKPVLTENETEFFGRLLDALPNYHVFPQVAFRAILAPCSPSRSQNYLKEFNSIGSKHCDFLVCEKGSLKVVAIVELDDRTHDRKKDMARDNITRSAGYNTIRFHSKNKPSLTEIKQAIKDISK